MEYRLTDHTAETLEERGISPDQLESVLSNPQQITQAKKGRKVYQSQIDFGGKIYLLRAIVEDHVSPIVVVSVYKTSKIEKYWRES